MYMLQYEVTVAWAPDGAGPMTQPAVQKYLMRPQPGPAINAAPGGILGGIAGATGTVTASGWPNGPGPVGILVPGGYPLTQANLRLALHGVNTAPVGGATQSLAGDIDAQLAAALARLQTWTTGGG